MEATEGMKKQRQELIYESIEKREEERRRKQIRVP